MARLIQYSLFPVFLLVFSFAVALDWVNLWLRERATLRPTFRAGYLAAGLVVLLDVLGLALGPARSANDVLAALSTEVFAGVRIFLFVTMGILTCARLGLPGLPASLEHLLRLQFPPAKPPFPEVQRRPVLEAFIISLLVAAAALAYSALLITLLHPQLNPDVPEGLPGSALLDSGTLSLASAVLLLGPALGEELIFRLGIQSWLLGLLPRFKLSPRWAWAALALTALAWTAGYVSLDPDWLKPLQIFPLALALGWLARRYGVGASILAHFLFSLGSVGILSGMIR